MEPFSVRTLETAEGKTKPEKLIFPRHTILCFTCPAERALWKWLGFNEVLYFVGKLVGPFVHVHKVTFAFRLKNPAI